MITVTLTRSGETLRCEFAGHAGYAEKGKDIVCAGVSALYYALTEGVRRQAPAAVSVAGTSVTLDLSSAAAAAVSQAVVAGLVSIAAAYPRHLSVRRISGYTRACPSGI